MMQHLHTIQWLEWECNMTEKLDDNTIESVTKYVWKNYKSMKDKPLVIKEKGKCFHVAIHEDASPLILGKGILDAKDN
jgi:hypothetical protein